RVLPSMEFGAIWDRFIDQVGGIFDPITGKADEAKIKIVRDHTRREMTNRFKADAVLHPSVQVVGAHVKGFRASWDGTAEEIVSDGWYRGFEQGTTQALSLIVLIEDVNGADLYAHRGGIQLISKTVRGRFVNIAASQILTREDQIVNAVNIVLNPFLEKQEPQGR
ncbi:MAG: hypothetical protein FJY85_25950, partial [Deltaproteobacteria bacterium]|nr:hypothetical protein [Deltaproteobacteria bacterium]